MDNQTIKALADQISSQVAFDWRAYLWIVILSFVGGASGAYLFSYFKTRGQHLATKSDFNELLRQLSKTTEATEKIKASIAHANWKDQKQWDFKRQIFQDVLEALSSIRFALLKVLVAVQQGKLTVEGPQPIDMFYDAFQKITKYEAIAGLVLGDDIVMKFEQIRTTFSSLKNIETDLANTTSTAYRSVRDLEKEICELARIALMKVD